MLAYLEASQAYRTGAYKRIFYTESWQKTGDKMFHCQADRQAVQSNGKILHEI